MTDAPMFTRRRLLSGAAGAAAFSAATGLMPPNVHKLMAQGPRRTGALKDIKHVVMLMLETDRSTIISACCRVSAGSTTSRR